MGEIKLRGFTIEQAEIEFDEAAYRRAVANETLHHDFDVYLSDMDGTTFVIEPDGTVVNPYGPALDPNGLMTEIRPVLDALPAWMVEQYVASRRAEEE